MIWTYFHLGQDMLQPPHPGRRQTLRQLLQALQWPAGSVAFWPMAVPVAGRYSVDIRFFWRGMRALGTKTVCCFGSACRAVLTQELGVLLPADQHVLHYRTGKLLFLPELEDAEHGREAAVSTMCAMLREHGPAW